MKIPTFNQVVALHSESLELFGGESGTLDRDGLEGFISSLPQASYFGEKSKKMMCAYIFVRLIQNHYFIDGNKRVGLGTLLAIMDLNNCVWTQNVDTYDLTMMVARTDYDILGEIEVMFEEIIECI